MDNFQRAEDALDKAAAAETVEERDSWVRLAGAAVDLAVNKKVHGTSATV